VRVSNSLTLKNINEESAVIAITNPAIMCLYPSSVVLVSGQCIKIAFSQADLISYLASEPSSSFGLMS
jgi:branched-subunit amino acid permease